MIERSAYDKSLYSQAARDINKPTSLVENPQKIDKITDNQQSQKPISSYNKWNLHPLSSPSATWQRQECKINPV
ncbi:hypothetical protein C1646_768511 [Rhizophagus diaphanus]|nr:hypothetical protein C1646_768511 [Rhizophagus diaphanus] [Rhizophagus sp. MUCL 43196]